MCTSPTRPYSCLVSLLYALDDYVIFAIYLVAAPVGVYAFVHALMQRADAFTAAFRQRSRYRPTTGASWDRSVPAWGCREPSNAAEPMVNASAPADASAWI